MVATVITTAESEAGSRDIETVGHTAGLGRRGRRRALRSPSWWPPCAPERPPGPGRGLLGAHRGAPPPQGDALRRSPPTCCSSAAPASPPRSPSTAWSASARRTSASPAAGSTWCRSAWTARRCSARCSPCARPATVTPRSARACWSGSSPFASAWFNWVHAPRGVDHAGAPQFFAGMSLSAAVLFDRALKQTRRAALREQGLVPRPLPQIRIVRWLRAPRETYAAWSLMLLEDVRSLDEAVEEVREDRARGGGRASGAPGQPPRAGRAPGDQPPAAAAGAGSRAAASARQLEPGSAEPAIAPGRPAESAPAPGLPARHRAADDRPDHPTTRP